MLTWIVLGCYKTTNDRSYRSFSPYLLMKDNPRLLVVVLVFIRREGQLLLVKQNYGNQYWSLPGGVVESGESITQAAIREVKEEAGLDVTIGRIVGLYSKPDENAIAITLEGEILGGELKPDHEISACQFFSIDKIPDNIREHLKQRIEDFKANQAEAFIRTQ